VGNDCWGIFDGALGYWKLSEMRRGVIQTALMHTLGAVPPDEDDYRELDAISNNMGPLFRKWMSGFVVYTSVA
jgi:hypothetical protein